MTPDPATPETARIDMWQEPDGRFRWALREDARRLLSNDSYASEEEALAAARTAYPDVPVRRERPGAGRRHGRRASVWSFLLAAVALWRAYRRGS